eukprot:scaffold91629_cov59-Attheya_sp.AAC.2
MVLDFSKKKVILDELSMAMKPMILIDTGREARPQQPDISYSRDPNMRRRGVASTQARGSPAVKQVTFGATVTGQRTPKQNARAKMKSVLESQANSLDQHQLPLVEQWKYCKGPLLYQVNSKGEQGPKRKCWVCHEHTSWKCMGCHDCFCSVSKAPAGIERAPVPSLVKISFPNKEVKSNKKSDEKDIVVRNTCSGYISIKVP